MYRSVRNIPKQLLENLYVKEGWTLRDVADYIGCSVDTVVRRMDDYNIPRRTKRKDISRATLVSLYEDNHPVLIHWPIALMYRQPQFLIDYMSMACFARTHILYIVLIQSALKSLMKVAIVHPI